MTFALHCINLFISKLLQYGSVKDAIAELGDQGVRNCLIISSIICIQEESLYPSSAVFCYYQFIDSFDAQVVLNKIIYFPFSWVLYTVYNFMHSPTEKRGTERVFWDTNLLLRHFASKKDVNNAEIWCGTGHLGFKVYIFWCFSGGWGC